MEAERERVMMSAPQHPAYSFYKGKRAAVLLTPSHEPFSEQKAAEKAFDCLSLHTTLFPPSAVVAGASKDANDESYAEGLASAEGLELLQLNWHFLRVLLLPVGLSRCVSSQSSSATSAEPIRFDSSEMKEMDHLPLSQDEGKEILSPAFLDRFHFTFIIFLRFYGWKLHDESRGVIDRHRSWAERYEALALCDGKPSAPSEKPPSSHTFNFYESGLPRMVQHLIDIHFFKFAVGLVEFLVEELTVGRLIWLSTLVERVLLPQITSSSAIDSSHKSRLLRKLSSLFESDSE